MWLRVEEELTNTFEGLRALIAFVRGVKVERENPRLQEFKRELIDELKRKYTLEQLKELEIFRAYRNFYWRVGIDPTKTRPSGEALLRRVLAGKPFPKINTLVDAYNLASTRTGIAIGAFDCSRLKGELLLRRAKPGESFTGIGMREPEILKGNEPVVCDGEKLIAIYPYRDSDETKVTEQTREALLLICGVPGIGKEKLLATAELTVEYITRFCGGAGEVP
jgi:DNA/RNA-binding domain of Phe-tRNA-synthetase-like protein